MTADVIFFHGAGDGAYDADAELADSLAHHLGDEFSVHLPRMPEGDDPGDQSWLRIIGESITHAEAPVALVGHSAGGYLLLKYLATRSTTRPIAVISIIAAPFPGGDPDWTFDGFALPNGFARQLPPEARILLYASRDDEIVPFAHRDLYAAAIPQATARTTTGGHQLTDGLRDIAEDIRAILRS